jgi:hypothetical protein
VGGVSAMVNDESGLEIQTLRKDLAKVTPEEFIAG